MVDGDPRDIERGYSSEESMHFVRDEQRRYVVVNGKNSYGVVGDVRGRFACILDFWVPSNVLVLPERLLLRGNRPDLSGQNPELYRWVDDVRVDGTEGRRITYVDSDLLQYEEGRDSFDISVQSQSPVMIHRVGHNEYFKWAVLNRRPRR